MTQPISFSDLPLPVRISTAASYFLAWVLVEEFIIDRHGYDRVLPFYRIGNLCPYDVAVALLIGVAWIVGGRKTPTAAARPTEGA